MRAAGIKSFKQHKITEQYDVICIGSGISCMTAAAILAKEGKRVLLLERHYTAGGYTHVFKRKGYEWDVGIHYIGNVTHPKALLAKMFQYITDGQLEWEDMGEIYGPRPLWRGGLLFLQRTGQVQGEDEGVLSGSCRSYRH